MSNKVLEKFDEINEKKKLSLEEKNIIMKKIFDNLIIATDIIAIFTILIVSSLFLEKQILKNIYYASSIVMLIFTIFVWELAYKKDDGALAICGIEMFVFSIVILFMPYLLLKLNTYPLKFINIGIMIYYIIKNFVMYHKDKMKVLNQSNDIKEIVKKESKDIKAEEDIKKMIESKKKKQEKIIKKLNVENKEKSKEKQKKATNTKTKKINNTKKATTAKKSTEKQDEKEITENKIVKRKSTIKSVKKDEIESNITKEATKKVNKKEKTSKVENVAPKKRGRPRKEAIKQ